MADRSRQRQLQEIAALRRVERGAAFRALTEARGRETAAKTDAAQARSAADDAEHAWDLYLAGVHFQPDHSRALAGLVVSCGDEARYLAERYKQAGAETHALERAWRSCDALCSHAERLVKNGARAMRRDRDERQAAASADRATILWRRP